VGARQSGGEEFEGLANHPGVPGVAEAFGDVACGRESPGPDESGGAHHRR
jgi:hypothetical protein